MKYTGITKFKNNCRLTKFNGRMMKAWKVPGTVEHGKYCMLRRMQEFANLDALKGMRKEEK